MDNNAQTEFAVTVKMANPHTICARLIGRRLVDLPGALQNEFWRYKLAGWVNDLEGVIAYV